jgi:hypothetical protein
MRAQLRSVPRIGDSASPGAIDLTLPNFKSELEAENKAWENLSPFCPIRFCVLLDTKSCNLVEDYFYNRFK